MNKDQFLLERAYDLIRLSESPEVVCDLYDRENYQFEFFLGDENGTLIKEQIPTINTHSDFLRKLYKGDAIDGETYEIDHEKLTDDLVDEVLGNPLKVDFNYSGIILPKQRDVPATYISFWREAAYEGNKMKLSKLLLDYAKSKFKGPYKYEVTEGLESHHSEVHNAE